MCGIAGIIEPKRPLTEETETIRMMTNALIHRGPDDEAYYRSPNGCVSFGHRRLSIVGLDDRPTIMTVPKKNNPLYHLALTFNGEIYNFKDLKQTFHEKGYRSISPSDFEVILFAWQEWKQDCVDHLIGEFAFAIYDEETNETFFARDRTGVKPLFYSKRENGQFLFASEPKALLASGLIPPQIDEKSVAAFVLGTHTFAAGTPDLSSSFFKGIRQLRAAHTALLRHGILELRRYWELPFSDAPPIGTPKTRVARVRNTLTNAIEARIPEEVGVSVSLSGGLDSSIVTAVAKQSSKTKNLLASSVRYEGDQNEDYQFAKLLTDTLQTPLSGPLLSAKALLSAIDRCIIAMDGSFDTIRRMGMIENYANIRKNGYKVTLIGEGADEFNLGYYHKFPGLKLDREHCQTPEALEQLISSRTNYVSTFFTPSFLQSIDWKELVQTDVAENYSACASTNPLKRMQHYYAKKFLAFLEDSNDRTAMANSVEARLPFVDPETIATCLNLPVDEQISEHGEKHVLRQAFAGLLPKAIAERRKAPFPATEDLTLHELIAHALIKEIQTASDAFWHMCQKKPFEQFSKRYLNRIQEIKRDPSKGGETLNTWLPMSGPVELRTAQAMCFLTLLRWYKLYFSNKRTS